MNGLDKILERLPDHIREPMLALPDDVRNRLEEIRIKINQPILIIAGGSEITVKPLKQITAEVLDNIVNNLMNYSIYAYEAELAKGYITIEGGHRVGICGRVVKNENNITLIKDISSLNIRRSREIKGIAETLKNNIISDLGLQNIVIVSPPKCGKTTLLRDIARMLSNDGYRVGVIDERSEIAGMYRGQPAYDIGPRTDVLDGCPKAEGMLMMIRSMAPDVIVTDEIGKSEDISAIETALCSGVKVITTIHGNTYEDLIKSRLGTLIENKTFTRVIFLTNTPTTGTISEVRYV